MGTPSNARARTGTRYINPSSLFDPMQILSSESRMLIRGVAGRMHAEHYGATIDHRILILCESLAHFGKPRLSKMTPQDIWENLKSYVHEEGNKHYCRFDTYPRKDGRHGKYPPVGICRSCETIQVARVKQRGARLIGQYQVTISNNRVRGVTFHCSSCIARDIRKTRSEGKTPSPYYSYEKALRLAQSEKKPKRNGKLARKSRVIARKLARQAQNFFNK